jgi:ribosomal protein L3
LNKLRLNNNKNNNKLNKIKKMSNTGVYSITNLTNNKIYIGSVSSKKGFNGRWSRHIFDLKNNKHHSKHLQLSWNKYGVNNYEFKII